MSRGGSYRAGTAAALTTFLGSFIATKDQSNEEGGRVVLNHHHPSPPSPPSTILSASAFPRTISNDSPNSRPNDRSMFIKCVDGTRVVPYRIPPRPSQISRLHSEKFDILVIGGGAVGCGVALDAASRGLNVALVERDDFCGGTSGRSTKLIHGGIRYLENAFRNLDVGEYRLVEEALRERKHMLEAAPYMNHPFPIMIPMFNKRWYDFLLVPYYLIGAKCYDLVAGGVGGSGRSGVPPCRFINAAEAKFQFPMLDDTSLLGAIIYYDGQFNDARYGLHLALTATQSGAAVASRVRVNSLVHDGGSGKVVGATVKDVERGKTFKIDARVVINCTGPFSDSIRRMDDPGAVDMIKPAAGVHVVLPDHYSPSNMGLIIPQTSDGRVLFFLPWENGTIAGTTDSESGLTMSPRATEEDIGFILEEANKYLKPEKTVNVTDVKSAWSGIRPLVYQDDSNSSNTASISRTHVISRSANNLFTLAGGKWTTYRKMAQDVVDLVVDLPELKRRVKRRKCTTSGKGIIGADRAGVVSGGKFDRVVVTLREEYQIPKDVAEHLVKNYGTRALQIGEMVHPSSRFFESNLYHERFGPLKLSSAFPFLEAEVVFACRQEYALCAVDVLARRTRLAYLDAEEAAKCIDRVVDIMGKELSWSWRRKKREKAEARSFINDFKRGKNE